MRTLSSISKFKTLDEFRELISHQDDYRLLPIHSVYAGREIHSARVFGMTNITKNRVTMACGPNYPVFGHREALGYIYSDLAKRMCDVHGEINTVGDTTWTRILFDNVFAKDENGDPVEMGMSFVNPMDKKTKFRGNAYTWRQTCSNGAGIKRNFPGLEINESHTVNMAIIVPPMIYDFIGNSLSQTGAMQKMIDDSAKTKVSFESRAQIVATLEGVFTNVTERHIRGIAANMETLEPTRWEMFNAATQYTSHRAISPVVREEIDSHAEKFIDLAYPIVPAYVPRVVA